MKDAIPTCGWSTKANEALVPCGQAATGVFQVWAVPVRDFMTDHEVQPMALLLCRDHQPREPLNVH